MDCTEYLFRFEDIVRPLGRIVRTDAQFCNISVLLSFGKFRSEIFDIFIFTGISTT